MAPLPLCSLIKSSFSRAVALGDSQKKWWVAGSNQCPAITPGTNLALDLASLALPPPHPLYVQNQRNHTLRDIESPLLLQILCISLLEAACPRAVLMCLELQIFCLAPAKYSCAFCGLDLKKLKTPMCVEYQLPIEERNRAETEEAASPLRGVESS